MYDKYCCAYSFTLYMSYNEIDNDVRSRINAMIYNNIEIKKHMLDSHVENN